MINLNDPEYLAWLLLRKKSKDKYGEKICYCGHTHKCSCADPDFEMFKVAVAAGIIKLNDPENGWKTLKI